MREGSGHIPVAVGLMRKAAALLDEEGEAGTATSLRQLVDKVLRARPLTAAEELAPQQACLIAGIPLGGEPTPDRGRS